MRSYWRDAISMALDEEVIAATSEQIDRIGASLEVSAEHESTASGRDMIPNPMQGEIERLRRLLKAVNGEHEAEVQRLSDQHVRHADSLRYRINDLQRRLEAAHG